MQGGGTAGPHYSERGIDAAVAEYRSQKARGFGDLYTNEADLNALGYRLLRRKRVPEAIDILKLNVEAYPNSANVYDSLGEEYSSVATRCRRSRTTRNRSRSTRPAPTPR